MQSVFSAPMGGGFGYETTVVATASSRRHPQRDDERLCVTAAVILNAMTIGCASSRSLPASSASRSDRRSNPSEPCVHP